MAEESNKVDAIVVAWNNCNLTLDCVEHLMASTLRPNVVVVDNGSSDGTPRAIRERFPSAVLIELEDNIGFGPAANVGIKNSEGEFVSIVNNDANVEPRYFELVTARFTDPEVGVASGVSMNPSTRRMEAAGAFADRSLGWFQYMNGEPPEAVDPDDPMICGPCFIAPVFRRAAIDRIGGFDDRLFAYWEDVDITMRLFSDGWKSAVVPEARVWHLGSASLGHRSLRQLELAAWGRGYVAGRYRVAPHWLLTELLIGVIDSLSLRNTIPLSRRIAGWRTGRRLPKRSIPGSINFISWWKSLKLRIATVRL